MNATLSHTITIPNGEVYKIIDSNGIILWKKERKYIISFNANGGSGTMADQEFIFGELQALPKNTFSKSGSTFYGWSLTPDGMAQYIDGQSVVGIGNGIDAVVLYAVWTIALNTKYTYTSNQKFVVPITGVYTIEMHGGGGGGGGGANAYSYDAVGSADASGGDGGGSGEIYTETLIKGTSYALTIGTGGSGGSADDVSSQMTATAQGSSGGTGGTTSFGSLYSVAGGEGGSGGYAKRATGTAKETNGSDGTAVGSLASGSSGGATTGTYGNGGSGGSGTGTYGSSTPNSGSKGQSGAIIIKLIEYSPYTVVFNSNSGSGSMSNQSINVNETTQLSTNTLTRSGYTFLGWSTTPDGDVVYTDGESVTNIAGSGETITLYAVWEIILEVGQQWTYTSNGTFTVQKTGKYSIEMHGGGGGGGGGVYCRTYMGTGSPTACAYGGAGGGSGELYTATLTKGTSYALTIGKGGSGGNGAEDEANIAEATADNGQDGGTTKFGNLYSISGGKGGGGAHVYLYNSKEVDDGANGASVGSLASGKSGGATTGSYGNGGSGGSATYYSGAESGSTGQNGVIIITYLG